MMSRPGLVVVALVLFATVAARAAEGPKPGETLDQST